MPFPLPLFRPFAFSLLVVSVLGAKCFLLFHYATSIGILSFILYFPTFFLQDVIAISLGRLLLRRGASALTSLIPGVIGICISFILFAAAASEIGFYINTGSEVEWSATQTLAKDPAAVSILMSGRRPVIISGVMMIIVAFLLRNILYNAIGEWLLSIWLHTLRVILRVTRRCRLVLSRRNNVHGSDWESSPPKEVFQLDEGSSSSSSEAWHSSSNNDDDESHSSAKLLPTEEATTPPAAPSKWTFLRPIFRVGAVLFILLLYIIRPPKPYIHMSRSLPLKMFDMFQSTPDFCEAQEKLARNNFPFPELIKPEHWHEPVGKYKGWAPGKTRLLADPYAVERPDWLPDPLPEGFERWNLPVENNDQTEGEADDESDDESSSLVSNQGCETSNKTYDPVLDPLRITNMDSDMLEPLQKAIEENDAKITHLVVIMMESIRDDVFPIQKGSHLHKMILEPNKEEDHDQINEYLSKLTPYAEKITGISGGWQEQNGSTGLFTPNEPGMGGLNVVGALSPSTYSAKSILGSHCGVVSLAVDFLEEHKHDIYQPCIPHILNLFNEGKQHRNGSTLDGVPKIQDREWETMWMQAATNDWDHQDKLTEQMGFKKSFYKQDLDDSSSKHYPPMEEETNYFGYADGELEPYLRDYINDGIKNNKRLLFSHITASSHHPWDTPESFNRTRYVPDGLLERHKVLDSYLNAVRYDDEWMGKVLGILEETGIANETLVVMMGDHGLGFPDDTEIRGTFGGTHVGNFRVPLLFRHPQLPDIQIAANATSLSVIPTILDLLINTGSIDERDSNIAEDLLHHYEGQSLIRPYKVRDQDRQAWDISVLNPGGQMLALASAAVPYRLIIPVEKEVRYRFSNIAVDSQEENAIEEWTLSRLIDNVKSEHGEEAADWVEEAEAIAIWWLQENRAMWNYNPAPEPESEEEE